VNSARSGRAAGYTRVIRARSSSSSRLPRPFARDRSNSHHSSARTSRSASVRPTRVRQRGNAIAGSHVKTTGIRGQSYTMYIVYNILLYIGAVMLQYGALHYPKRYTAAAAVLCDRATGGRNNNVESADRSSHTRHTRLMHYYCCCYYYYH